MGRASAALAPRSGDAARGSGFRRVFLWTLGGLDAATTLYEEAGFRLEEEGTGSQFGMPALERRFGLAL